MKPMVCICEMLQHLSFWNPNPDVSYPKLILYNLVPFSFEDMKTLLVVCSVLFLLFVTFSDAYISCFPALISSLKISLVMRMMLAMVVALIILIVGVCVCVRVCFSLPLSQSCFSPNYSHPKCNHLWRGNTRMDAQSKHTLNWCHISFIYM